MAEIIEKKVKYIKCDCGEEFQTFGDDVQECMCHKAYKMVENSNNLLILGYVCWNCEKYKPHLYDDDGICADCMSEMVDYWQEMVRDTEESLKRSRKRLKSAQNLLDGSFEDR